MNGKKIILGISGGIAAYKAAFLIRLFKREGADVRVVGTAHAFEFITRVTLESLSENKVYDSLFSRQNDYSTEHVSLSDWGDVFVVAPATANIIGKLANGIADDALSTSLLAFERQVFIAPAMNCKMYDHFSVQENLRKLSGNGVRIISPGEGFLACGYEGRGRMEEPEEIFRTVSEYFSASNSLSGKRVLVTAGPTYEAIDPVRFIGNHSSGRMGYALAEELAIRGADVFLVSGPTHMQVKHPKIELVSVVSAREMYDACMDAYPGVDGVIMAAAVADFAPARPHLQKMKKRKAGENIRLDLVPTRDILKEMGALKKGRVVAGFALETEHGEENASKKLREKHLDFIVLNSPEDDQSGFNHPTNKITIIDNKGEIQRFSLKSKKDAAIDIADAFEKHLNP